MELISFDKEKTDFSIWFRTFVCECRTHSEKRSSLTEVIKVRLCVTWFSSSSKKLINWLVCSKSSPFNPHNMCDTNIKKLFHFGVLYILQVCVLIVYWESFLYVIHSLELSSIRCKKLNEKCGVYTRIVDRLDDIYIRI